MISKQIVNLIGLELHVFGLEEYRQLPEGTPLCAVFFSNPVQSTQEYVEESCREMCTLNDNRKPNHRYLIMISLDHPNSGTRLLHRDDPYHYVRHTTMNLMNQMYVNGKTTAQNISTIIECFDIHVFGEESNISVEKWGVVGMSMGGLTGGLAASIDPKVELVVMMAASLRYKLWMKHVGVVLKIQKDYASKKRTIKMLDEKMKDIYNKVSDTKLLMLYGDEDPRLDMREEEKNIEDIRRTHKGKEGVDWDYMILPVKGHKVCSTYNVEAMKWVYKWMISNPQPMTSKI